MVHMQLEVLNTQHMPPGGWDCVIIETGMRWQGEGDYRALVGKVAGHLRANKLDGKLAKPRVHATTGARLIAEGFDDLINRKRPQKARRTLAQWWSGAKAGKLIAAREKAGLPILCAPAEAEARAQICVGKCFDKHNVALAKNVVEQTADEVLAGRVAGRTTKNDKLLRACAVCTCELRTLVHLHQNIFQTENNQAEAAKYPDYCWKAQLLKNLAKPKQASKQPTILPEKKN